MHTSISLSVESRTVMRSLYRWTKAMRLSWLGPFWPFLAAGDLCIFDSGEACTVWNVVFYGVYGIVEASSSRFRRDSGPCRCRVGGEKKGRI